ncbi:uncharacterized protein A4U43_C02F16110 [Asparagus officinalis]|uniref:Uncharacterized protein n=1 Tax=Asparagus officinalis TaxID=4686 RepID=A0A5P1FNN6_ASPOF|nr:uncharacterized protein A4U43_C02F16110 [Asparagus officinalis]
MDHADVLARVEKAAVAHAKRQLDATEATIAKLQEEIKHLKSKPLQEETAGYYDISEKERGASAFTHWISEVESGEWESARVILSGVLLGRCSPRRELFEDDKFVPSAFLDRETSNLGSLSAPIMAVQQFSLPKDNQVLRRMPSCDLHLALKGHLV